MITQAMNRLRAMKTIPQIHIVIISASSIDPQLDARGVCHHGANNWKAIDTNTNRAIAIAIATHLPRL
jgi:hypothetical protein